MDDSSTAGRGRGERDEAVEGTELTVVEVVEVVEEEEMDEIELRFSAKAFYQLLNQRREDIDALRDPV